MCYVFYGVGLSLIVFTILTMMTAFPHMAKFMFINFIIIDINLALILLYIRENLSLT